MLFERTKSIIRTIVNNTNLLFVGAADNYLDGFTFVYQRSTSALNTTPSTGKENTNLCSLL